MTDETGDLSFSLRHIEPADYAPLIAVVDEWWGGRSVSHLLPRLFFVHFRPTSFIAESGIGERIGFLIGFLSQTFSDEAYIHFVGVYPAYRSQGVGRALYERFFAAARKAGRPTVRCITSPVNTASIAFHARMGFAIEPGDGEVDGICVHQNHDGRGGDRVLFVKRLTP